MTLISELWRSIHLRQVVKADLDVFYRNQLETRANLMAAFTAKDPYDRDAFDFRWHRILNDQSVLIRSIAWDEYTIGHVMSLEKDFSPEINFWIGSAYWDKGIASFAVKQFLTVQTQRPVFARVAKDNLAAYKVLSKNGFKFEMESESYSNARHGTVSESVMRLSEEE